MTYGSRLPIGIIGGMGPEATILLMKRVFDKTEASDDQDHVPLLVDNNTQVPSRIAAIISKTGEDPGPVIAIMAKKLEQSGARALAMPCNTAHYYKSDIESSVDIPFLDMISLTTCRLKSLNIKSAGLLASPAVRLTGTFDKVLKSRGIRPMYPENQDALLEAIRDVKRYGDNASSRSTLSHSAQLLVNAGADILVVACSELSIICDAISNPNKVIDTIDVLAEEIVKFSCRLAKES